MKKIKNWIKKTRIAPYLYTPYGILIDTYWWTRRNIIYKPVVKEVNGVSAEFVPEGQINNYHEFKSERENINIIMNDMSDDDVFYDIGANIGIYSCLLSQAYPGAEILAFEPSPPAFDYLNQHADLNGGEIKRFQMVISNVDDNVEFFIDSSDPMARMSSLMDGGKDVEYESVEVPSKKLDTLIREQALPNPTVIKIDVEGAEFDVLNGMSEAIDSVRLLYCEIHHDEIEGFGATGERVKQFLYSKGFEISKIQVRSGNEFIKATKIKNEE